MTKAQALLLVADIKAKLHTYNTTYGLDELFKALLYVNSLPIEPSPPAPPAVADWDPILVPRPVTIYNSSYMTREDWIIDLKGSLTTAGFALKSIADIIGDSVDIDMAQVIGDIYDLIGGGVTPVPVSQFTVNVIGAAVNLVLDTRSILVYSTCKWLITVRNGTTGRYICEILALNQGTGTAVSFTQTYQMAVGAALSGLSFDVDVSSGQMRLLLNCATPNVSVDITRSQQ
jgi:hypothetical protein